MKLSVLAILLGLVFGLPNVYALINPEGFKKASRRFPRNTTVGYVLVLAATAWFIHYVWQEKISEFENIKMGMCALFAAVGIGTCFFVKDFLAVRGLAVVMLLLAKLMVDTARWVDTDWRLVIVSWAYLMVIMGIWLTFSPWRFRDMIHWGTDTPRRIRVFSGLRLAFALFVVILGLTAFRSAEAREIQQSPTSRQEPGDSRDR